MIGVSSNDREGLSNVLVTRQDRMMQSLGVFQSVFRRYINDLHPQQGHHSTPVKPAQFIFCPKVPLTCTGSFQVEVNQSFKYASAENANVWLSP